MGIGELLVHTYDISHGLGHDWRPPRDPRKPSWRCLHPDSPAVDDPSALLLWSTGRIDIDGLDQVDTWVWRASSR